MSYLDSAVKNSSMLLKGAISMPSNMLESIFFSLKINRNDNIFYLVKRDNSCVAPITPPCSGHSLVWPEPEPEPGEGEARQPRLRGQTRTGES